MRTRLLVGTAALAVTVVFSSCSGQPSPTKPDPAGASALLGTWQSTPDIPVPTSCSTFTWEITEVNGNTGSGKFSASCGGFEVNGTANGTLSGNTVTFTASATATGPDGFTCPISLSGTATIDGDLITIPFTGTTCFGPVSGTQVLKKKK